MRPSNTGAASAPRELESFLDALRYFLTPQLGKQVLPAFRPSRASRGQPQPLVLILLVLTWCSGDSSPERFETARAFHVALYQKRRRPGTTSAGFQKALARVPMAALRLVAAAVRRRLAQTLAARFRAAGLVPIGCDGSRVVCPRSAESEQRLSGGSKDDSESGTFLIVLSKIGDITNRFVGIGI